jgi:hypothetical protein
MNTKLLLSLLAVTLSFGLGTARAVNAANDGDVLIGFSAATNAPQGAGTSYVVNLGSRVSFESNFNQQIQSIGADLVTIYGDNWYFQNNVTWGFISALSEDNSIYASVATGSRGWASLGSNGNYNTQSPGSAQIGRLYTSYNAAFNSGATLTAGVQVSNSNVDSWDALVNDPSGASFGYFSGPITTLANEGLDIWIHDATAYGSDPTAGPTNLTLGAIPEPSTYALMGFGALLMIVAYRRKTQNTNV